MPWREKCIKRAGTKPAPSEICLLKFYHKGEKKAMAVVYCLPTIDDRQVIQSAVELFLQTKHAEVRTRMIGAISKVLDKYGVSTINLTNFRVFKDYDGEDELIHIAANYKTDDEVCPRCEKPIFGNDVSFLSQYRAGNRHIISTYGCHSCGLVFGRDEGREADLL